MSRILVTMSLLALLLFAVVLGLGLAIGDLPAVFDREQDVRRQLAALDAKYAPTEHELETSRRLRQEQPALRQTINLANLHRLFGVGAAVLIVLVDSIVVTYFVGTSRWCKEVVEAYSLDRELAARSARLKRRTFPWTLASMLLIVAITALGAASDPMTQLTDPANWRTLHLTAAMTGLVVSAAAFWVSWKNVRANYHVIAEIVGIVRQQRVKRGLAV